MRVLGATALSHSEISRLNLNTLIHAAKIHNITLDIIANVYDRAETTVPSALRTVHVNAFKGLFWYKHITPLVSASYDFVWLFDSDLGVADFALWNVIDAMIKHDASAAQPRIRRLARKSTDHLHLRVRRECMRCEAQCTDFIEVMTPVFTRDAWTHVYTGLLRSLPRTELRLSVGGIDTRWCAYLSDKIHGKSACLVSNATITHYDYRTLRHRGMRRSNDFIVLANKGMRDHYPCPFCLRSGFQSCKSFERHGYTARKPRLAKNVLKTFFSAASSKEL